MSKTRYHPYNKALVINIFLIIIFGCVTQENKPQFIDPTAHPELVDQNWFTGNPCPAPCWHGLEVGKSLREEALNTARDLSFVGTEETDNPDDSWSHFNCKNPKDEPCVAMKFEKGILTEVVLYPNYSITLEQAVEHLGQPDLFTSIYVGELKTSCNLSFIWLKLRIKLNTDDEPYGSQLCDQIYHANGKVPKDLMINAVYINSTGRMEEIINNINLPMSGYTRWIWTGLSN